MQSKKLFLAIALCFSAGISPCVGQETALDTAKAAYEHGDYNKAIEILKSAGSKQPDNQDVQALLMKVYLDSNQYEEAIKVGEKDVASDPKNSELHQLLGEAYGDKADHAGMLSAYSWARKTQKEFEAGTELDPHNYDAAQDLVEYDCTAPGVVGGGEDKAQPVIQKLMSLDPAEGHFAAGVCKAVKKDLPGADAEYAKALESKPKTADRIYDIGDYFAQRGQGDKVLEVAAAGESLAPGDARAKYYRAVGSILKGEKYPDAEKLLKDYLAAGPFRAAYPKPWDAHYWLGCLYAAQKNTSGAKSEYQEALKLNPKYKKAQEALKQLGGQ
jgi:tetratricopeptide (TPR) repeat protein